MRPYYITKAMNKLWEVTPLGSGADLNSLINYIEYLEQRLKDK